MVDLRKIRTDAGMTQQQLADACHVVRQTICEIERGVNRPSIQTAQSIAGILNFDWTEFFKD